MSAYRETTREACDNCHTKKLKCERIEGTNICRKCNQGGITCNYSPRTSSGPRKRRTKPKSSKEEELRKRRSPDIQYKEYGMDASISDRTGESDPNDPLSLNVLCHPQPLMPETFDGEWNFGPSYQAGILQDLNCYNWDPNAEGLDENRDHNAPAINDYQFLSPSSSSTTESQNSRTSLSSRKNLHIDFGGQMVPESSDLTQSTSQSQCSERSPQVILCQTRKESVACTLQRISDLQGCIQKHTLAIAEFEVERKQLRQQAQITRPDPTSNPETSHASFSPVKPSKPVFPIDETLRISQVLIRAISDTVAPPSAELQASYPLTPTGSSFEEASPHTTYLDDSAILLILSCYLSLLKVYDVFLIEAARTPTSDAQDEFLLPVTKIGSFKVPDTSSNTFALRLIVEAVVDMKGQLSRSVGKLRAVVGLGCVAGEPMSSNYIVEAVLKLVPRD